MQIQITGRHFSVSDTLKQHIEHKIGKLGNHFDHIISTKVVLSVEREKQQIEAVVEVPNNKLVAKSEAQDMYAAVDLLQDKLDAQIRKHKQKLKDHRNEKLEISEASDEEGVDSN